MTATIGEDVREERLIPLKPSKKERKKNGRAPLSTLDGSNTEQSKRRLKWAAFCEGDAALSR